jgi:cytochrome c oxidase cbb3-type subunit III
MKQPRLLPVCAALLLTALTQHVIAQEPEGPPAGARARGRGRANTREFLGLGAAPDPVAAKKGEPLYQQNCSTCHGTNARGSQGPNLVRSVTVLHDEKDDEIGPVIKNGRPGMPGFPNLTQDDIHNIAQYLKMQVELAANRGTYGQTYGDLRNKVTGDPKKGEEFFRTNCTSCHSSTGDLAKIGAKFQQAQQLQSRFLWPATPGPAKAKVETASGRSFTGTIRKMDDFEISFVDSAGDYHWWPLNQIKVTVADNLSGHRALLPKYSNADIHNMTAYLVTLK